MEELRQHEIFEMEVLEGLKNQKLLEPLVFGGGTMLRLCYELKRYSTDLDFWFIKQVEPKKFFNKVKVYLQKSYEVTDAQVKYHTLLFEIRSEKFPRRLKIEIRKGQKVCDFQDRIAFSPYTTKQVIVRVHTLEQALQNKVAAALDRKDIRDYFDLEFLLRQGAGLRLDKKQCQRMQTIIAAFKDNDYKVTLGSVLPQEIRRYYIEHKFEYILRKIEQF